MGRFESEVLHQRFRSERLRREADTVRALRAARATTEPSHGATRPTRSLQAVRATVAGRLRAWAERLDPAPFRGDPRGA